MVAVGTRKLLMAAVIPGVVVLSGCGSLFGGDEGAGTPTIAAEVPTGFDPCTDIPEEIMASENLRDPEPDDFRGGGVKWKGCMWVQTDGYTASIQVTNLTLDMVREKKYPGTEELVIDGRKAITSQRSEIDIESACDINVEIEGGSLEFSLDNPPMYDKTGHQDTCELAKNLAGKVAPSIPDEI